jgi:hypothetical protein
MVRIDHLLGEEPCMVSGMNVTEKEALAVRCPTCGAKPGEKCELSTGLPRTDPHRDRRLEASEKESCEAFRQPLELKPDRRRPHLPAPRRRRSLLP